MHVAGPKNRRPLASRDTSWARRLVRRLAATGMTPNQISAASIGAAAFAGLALAGVAWSDGALRLALLFVGGVLVQVRLLCNLFDGMLAVEAGRASPTGAFWNEVPDRPSDMLILVGAGIGADAAWLGWAAAALAILVAYLRAFGQSLGQDADYRGPMAKQHRMAAITIACAAGILLSPWLAAGWCLYTALWIVVLGSVWTGLRRARRIMAALADRSR